MIKRPISELPEKAEACTEVLLFNDYYVSNTTHHCGYSLYTFMTDMGAWETERRKQYHKGDTYFTHFYYLSELEEGIPSVDDGRGEIDDLSPAARAECDYADDYEDEQPDTGELQ